ncbi:hypothetical protein F4678DRAFT_463686 [Xylaria arbuscula]|nr:hypothetical protein F4678DRAFT_463686 [Xylaria arbuscula]
MPCFYELKMLRLFEQYELSDNARVMFKALEDFQTARLDEAGLGRLIRLSPNNRAALVNTMVKCASIMKEKPKESKYCLDIITSCGNMLEIADRPAQGVGFPGFLRLPLEIRHRIYSFYLRSFYRGPVVVPSFRKGDCHCVGHVRDTSGEYIRVRLELGFTSKQISRELLSHFYRKRMLHFACPCQMNHHLTNNALLKSTLKKVMFHWCGNRADEGIRQLQEMRQLDAMTIVISKMTGNNLTQREKEIREYFGTKRSSSGSLAETLGWEELISIRGLKHIEVEHIDKRKAERRTEGDRKCLENMLVAYLLRPAPFVDE